MLFDLEVVVCRMDYHGPEDFANPVPTLPPDVRLCEGIPRAKWVAQPVTLQDEHGADVARRVIQNIDPEMVFDQNRKCLDDDRVAVHIAESLNEELFSSANLWSIRSWHIRNVFLYDGASLYDHDETQKYNMVMNPRRARKGFRSYETTRVRIDPEVPPKKQVLLTIESIIAVSTKTCCRKICVQHFPRAQIQAIRIELYGGGDFKACNKTLLKVHKHIHKDVSGKEWITLKEREVCPTAWWIIHGIAKCTFYRYKEKAKSGKEADVHGNLGSKKPRMETIQAIATLRRLIELDADKMPHKTRTLESGEKVTAMVLPSSLRWSDQLKTINESNASLNLPPISSSALSNIRHDSFPEYAAKARGDSFARCDLCDKYNQLRSACVGEEAKSKWEELKKIHNKGQLAHRTLYYGHREESIRMPDKVLCIIHDKMDHSKTASPHFSHKTKVTESFMKMPIAVTGMIAHGHGDVRYAHYGLDIYPTDSNHTIGSIARLLRDLEGVPRNSSCTLFSIEDNQSALTKALLNGVVTCLDSLLPPPDEPLPPKPLPPVLMLQLDNCSGDNKNRYVFGFCSMLVYKGIFREVYINFLIVEHTYEDIDALFGRWSSRLKTNNYPTLPRLMKSFMDTEKHPVIPHLIEEVPDFKAFVHGYLGTSGDFLEGHSRSQQFKFFKDSNGWPLMEYKNLCTDDKWLPEGGKGIKLWSENAHGLPKVPTGNPPPLVPEPMKALQDVKKGLNGFVAY